MFRLIALALAVPLLVSPVAAPQETEFSRLVARLSEGPGFFQSDNLVSNETSYLHALDTFRAMKVRGGAYLGVGPEQSFSYIAEIEPEVAILIDIRRDNLLLHLLLKAMFETSRNRLEYLGLLYGRPMPDDLYLWTDLDLEALLDYIDQTPPNLPRHRTTHQALLDRIASHGMTLSPEDLATLQYFHDEFVSTGLDIRYSTRGRGPRLSFPTNRQIYLETDLTGSPGSYLASEDRWRRVRNLHLRSRIIPVMGDLSGPRAVRAIGDYLREIRQTVSVFYVSNVEQYLFRGGTFPAFVDNVRTLPVRDNSVMVRSWFGRGMMLSTSLPGHFSTQITQTIPRFLQMARQPETLDYWMLVNDAILPVPLDSLLGGQVRIRRRPPG